MFCVHLVYSMLFARLEFARLLYVSFSGVFTTKTGQSELPWCSQGPLLFGLPCSCVRFSVYFKGWLFRIWVNLTSRLRSSDQCKCLDSSVHFGPEGVHGELVINASIGVPRLLLMGHHWTRVPVSFFYKQTLYAYFFSKTFNSFSQMVNIQAAEKSNANIGF